jgi:hypothetical protein
MNLFSCKPNTGLFNMPFDHNLFFLVQRQFLKRVTEGNRWFQRRAAVTDLESDIRKFNEGPQGGIEKKADRSFLTGATRKDHSAVTGGAGEWNRSAFSRHRHSWSGCGRWG